MNDLIQVIEERLIQLGGDGKFTIREIHNQEKPANLPAFFTHVLLIQDDRLYFCPRNLLASIMAVGSVEWEPESPRFVINQIVIGINVLVNAIHKGIVVDATGADITDVEFLYDFSRELNITPGRLFAQMLSEFKRLHDSEPELAKLIAFNDFSQN